MWSIDKQIKHSYDSLINMEWKFDDRFDRCFLEPHQVNVLMMHISTLRMYKAITPEERAVFLAVVNSGRKRYLEFKEHIYNAPRREAQSFIGKKNIREFIFKRDNYRCLCCGSNDNLSIDHIKSINSGGENKISNLQTLCRSCNSSKSTKFIDYRQGGRK